jgi:hypothetical protein
MKTTILCGSCQGEIVGYDVVLATLFGVCPWCGHDIDEYMQDDIDDTE